MAESSFVPTWRYNPLKHELQFWFSPMQAVAFEESLLKVLEQLPLVPITLGEAIQLVKSVAERSSMFTHKENLAEVLGGWRNTKHESLLKLPPSTR